MQPAMYDAVHESLCIALTLPDTGSYGMLSAAPKPITGSTPQLGHAQGPHIWSACLLAVPVRQVCNEGCHAAYASCVCVLLLLVVCGVHCSDFPQQLSGLQHSKGDTHQKQQATLHIVGATLIKSSQEQQFAVGHGSGETMGHGPHLLRAPALHMAWAKALPNVLCLTKSAS